MRILIAILVILFAAPAWAQMKGRPPEQASKTASPADAAKKRADAEAYQRALKSIPEPKANTDPWSGTR